MSRANKKVMNLALSLLAAPLLLAACSQDSANLARMSDGHVPLELINAGVSAASAGVSAQAINIGTIYLETQYAPPTVSGYALQASDVSVKGSNVYVSYSYRDPSGLVKAGAVEQFNPYKCDSLLTSYTDYCLSIGGLLSFPNSNIFSTVSDGTNLYAVGTTTSASSDPYYGRLFKVPLNGAGAPTAISATATLPSYAGTGVAIAGANALVTYGTSTNAPMMGGLASFNLSTLAPVNNQTLFDARDVMVDPTNSSRAFVVTGASSISSLGKTIEYNADASGSALRSITSGGNSIAESRSTILVGNQLMISTAGDQGFSVMCKATGAILVTKGAPLVSGITSTNTVTNGVAAVPGYLLVANGEAGVYVYQFNKTNLLSSNLCDGVSLTLLGRLSLAATGTYVNAELSANSIHAVNVLSVLNVVTSRLIVIASGNKGISLLNVTDISLPLAGVDDF